jgi:hypothetical protein
MSYYDHHQNEESDGAGKNVVDWILFLLHLDSKVKAGRRKREGAKLGVNSTPSRAAPGGLGAPYTNQDRHIS